MLGTYTVLYDIKKMFMWHFYLCIFIIQKAGIEKFAVDPQKQRFDKNDMTEILKKINLNFAKMNEISTFTYLTLLNFC